VISNGRYRPDRVENATRSIAANYDNSACAKKKGGDLSIAALGLTLA